MSGAPPLVEPLEGLGDPADVAARFLDLPWLVLLDSASAGSGVPDGRALGRYSFLSADPTAIVRSKGNAVQVLEGGAWRETAGDALEVARGWLREMGSGAAPGLPPFQGGVAGYIGYDYGAVLERLPPTRYDDLALPDVVLGRYDWVIAWDQQAGAAWLVSTGRRTGAAPHGAGASGIGGGAVGASRARWGAIGRAAPPRPPTPPTPRRTSGSAPPSPTAAT